MCTELACKYRLAFQAAHEESEEHELSSATKNKVGLGEKGGGAIKIGAPHDLGKLHRPRS